MVEIKKYGNKERRFISGKDINRIRNSKSAKYKNKSDKEKLKEIFDALEFDINEQEYEEISKTLSLSDVENIHIDTSYIKVGENGVQTEVSETEALNAAEEAKRIEFTPSANIEPLAAASDTSPTASHSNSPVLSPDGYMKQQISVTYTPNYHGTASTLGRYVILGNCIWLNSPNNTQRGTDIISLYSSHFDWYDPNTDGISNYFLFVGYNKYYYDENNIVANIEDYSVAYDETKASISEKDGVYFKYDLPNDPPLAPIICTDFNFLIMGICQVKDYDDPTQSLSMGVRYIHMRNVLSVSVSPLWKSAGISVSGYHMPVYYDASHKWDYKDDFYA